MADEEIMMAELSETQRRLQRHLEAVTQASEHHGLLLAAERKLQTILDKIETLHAKGAEVSRDILEEVRREMCRLLGEIRGLERQLAFA